MARSAPLRHAHFHPVNSLNDTTLVYAPDTRTKYSNAGIAVIGLVLERVSGRPFAEYVQTEVLDAIGLEHASFTRTEAIE